MVHNVPTTILQSQSLGIWQYTNAAPCAGRCDKKLICGFYYMQVISLVTYMFMNLILRPSKLFLDLSRQFRSLDDEVISISDHHTMYRQDRRR